MTVLVTTTAEGVIIDGPPIIKRNRWLGKNIRDYKHLNPQLIGGNNAESTRSQG